MNTLVLLISVCIFYNMKYHPYEGSYSNLNWFLKSSLNFSSNIIETKFSSNRHNQTAAVAIGYEIMMNMTRWQVEN